MRKTLFILGLLLFTSGIARAACDRFEVAGGYKYLRVGSSIQFHSGSGGGSGSTTTNFNGWNAEVAGNLSCWVGIVGNFGGVYSSPMGANVHIYNQTFGPRVSLHNPTPVTPFVEALFGAAEIGGSSHGVSLGSQSAFAGEFGGGVDVSLGGPFAVRAKIDDDMSHFFSQYQHNLAVVAEVVFKFGGR
jgi:hypothetical protein